MLLLFALYTRNTRNTRYNFQFILNDVCSSYEAKGGHIPAFRLGLAHTAFSVANRALYFSASFRERPDVYFANLAMFANDHEKIAARGAVEVYKRSAGTAAKGGIAVLAVAHVEALRNTRTNAGGLTAERLYTRWTSPNPGAPVPPLVPSAKISAPNGALPLSSHTVGHTTGAPSRYDGSAPQTAKPRRVSHALGFAPTRSHHCLHHPSLFQPRRTYPRAPPRHRPVLPRLPVSKPLPRTIVTSLSRHCTPALCPSPSRSARCCGRPPVARPSHDRAPPHPRAK